MTNNRIFAALITLFIMSIVVTPFCDLLFDCGCNWPWNGLAKNCNYFTKRSHLFCPWCNSLTAGTISVLLSITAGLIIPIKEKIGFFPFLSENQTVSDQGLRVDFRKIAFRTLLGIGIFLSTAVLTGWITAISMGYPKLFGFML
ncbi:MAG: hypothetical protein V3V31_15540 [Methylococcales bacterium]